MNEQIRLVTSVVLVTLLSTVMLAITDKYTSPVIEAKRHSLVQDEIRILFPDVDSVQKTDEKILVIGGKDIIGTIVITSASGYSSDIEVMVGINPDKTLAGVVVLHQEETPGLGSKVSEHSFLDQFTGKSEGDVELSKHGGAIDGVTGATISSDAVTTAVRKVMEEYT